MPSTIEQDLGRLRDLLTDALPPRSGRGFIVGPSHAARWRHVLDLDLLPAPFTVTQSLGEGGFPVWNRTVFTQLFRQHEVGQPIFLIVPDFRFGNSLAARPFVSGQFYADHTHIRKEAITPRIDAVMYRHQVDCLAIWRTVFGRDLMIFDWTMLMNASTHHAEGRYLEDGVYQNPAYAAWVQSDRPRLAALSWPLPMLERQNDRLQRLVVDRSQHPSALGFLTQHGMMRGEDFPTALARAEAVWAQWCGALAAILRAKGGRPVALGGTSVWLDMARRQWSAAGDRALQPHHEGTTAAMDEGPLTVPPRVAVLMATFNGATHLEEQLVSLAAQTVPPAWLIVGDDGSDDDTRGLLAQFAQAHPAIDLRVLEGPRKGGAMNFLSLLAHVPPGAEAVGFCDQDDVWLPEKTARACAALGRAAGPMLYCAATWVCDEALRHPRLSRTPSCATGFRHALVQNVAGGNTMMVNRAAVDLLMRAARGVGALVVHDWWAYQVISGAGGTVAFDPEPCLFYRQHGRNQIGANDGTRARLRRIAMLLGGHFRDWNAVNLAALRAARPLLTAEAHEVLDRFETLRRAPLPRRLRLLRQAGLYRQDLAGNASLWVAAVLGRL